MAKSSDSRIYLSPPHLSGYELTYIKEALDTNWIAPVGPNLDGFEKDMSNYLGLRKAVALSSGTAAIHLALNLLKVQKGDTVFCSTLTFVASANPVLYQGAKPVFIDSDRESWNMSPIALERALSDAYHRGKMPKAVIIVNLYGQIAKMAELMAICNTFRVPVIEDAAESLGSTYHMRPSGTFGVFSVFSFNGNKIITTSGGGMLTAGNSDIIEKARFLATQAKEPAEYYQHNEVGYNYRMSNLLAGVGRAQLLALEDRVNAKRAVFKRYYDELSHLPGIEFMPELPNTRSNRWLTVLTVNEKEAGFSSWELLSSFAAENIEARPVWKPLHLQPLFEGTNYYRHNDLVSISEELFHKGICLPSGTNMSEKDQQRVVDKIKSFVKVKAV